MMLEEMTARSMSCGISVYTAQLSGGYIIISEAFLISILSPLTLCLGMTKIKFQEFIYRIVFDGFLGNGIK